MTKRLTPLIDDPSQPDYVRELLETGRHARVSDYDYGSGLTRHLAQINAAVPTPPWAESLQSSMVAGAGAAGVAGSSLVAWIALPVVGASVLAAVLLSSGAEPAKQPGATTVRSVPAAAVPARPEPLLGEAAAPAEPRISRAPEEVPTKASAPRSQPRSGRSPALHAARRVAPSAPAKSIAAGPNRITGVTSAASSPAESVRETKSGAAPTRAAQVAERAPAAETLTITDPEPAAQPEAAAPSAEPAAVRGDDARLEREMGMLSISQRVLHSDPGRALSLARQGEAEFSGSMFTQERQQLLLLSLVKLGRIEEAKRLARPYLARYPNGPFSDRVRRALVSGRVER